MANFNPHMPGLTERDISSSLSPERGVASSEDDKAGASALDPEFYKNLTDKRTTRDGNPPKKRGPKPNSKPALTRRQELNRQAQRTHRERKELYIKALEDEVLRLKEVFSNVSLDRERLAEENKRLRDTLTQAGLQYGSPFAAGSATSRGPGSSSTNTPPLTSHSTAPSVSSPIQLPLAANQGYIPGQQRQDVNPIMNRGGADMEQAGIDFVLTLEKPCMAHIQYMIERAAEPDGEPCGHALMASCPPDPSPDSRPGCPFGNTHVPVDGEPNQKTWEVPKADLATLLDLSKRLDLDGEVTPIMAWGMLTSHPRAMELDAEDMRKLGEELVRKVRCYGFGAVMEEFEVRDAMDNVFGGKDTVIIACEKRATQLLLSPHLAPIRLDSTRLELVSVNALAQQEIIVKMADSLDYVQICESCPAGDGWGPPVTSETTLNGVPYAPFSKGDKLGRMADWTAEGKDRERGGRAQYNRNFRDQQVYGSSHAVTFNAPPAEDESTFSVVSNVRDSTKTRYGRGAVFTRGRGQRGGQAGGRGGRTQLQRTGAGGRQGYGGYDRGGRSNTGARGRRFGWKDYDKPARNRDASINIKAEWKLLEEIDFNRLAKLNLDTDEGEDIDDYGFLYYYDRSYDKQPVKGAEKKLTAIDRAAYNVTTSSDPVIQELADKDEATIFATDSILSMLMCSPRSVYPWDIVISRQGNKVFLDKRDNAALDMVTVNENAADAPLDAADGSKDTVNQPNALAEEATYINHNFANQVVHESESSKVTMAHANPFYNSSEDTDPPASKAYKYRRFDLSTNDEEPVHLIVRTEVDAVQKNAISGDDQLVSIHALNEFDSKAQGSGGALDWRSKLVTQRGAVVATEMKNNSCKLARWTVQSILAKSDVMKLGFVSRVNPRSNDKHVVLGVVGWKPRDFANQMNLSLSNGWGIVRTIADMCLNSANQDAKFVLVKDPNKSILRLYEVPAGSFDDDEEEEEEPQAEEE
ncbi:hypothetical protein FDECE_10428 [Fusarium decemcellulare]|nr:hypothetical protein FDECE_10428 [Fusarium decemcellulare]